MMARLLVSDLQLDLFRQFSAHYHNVVSIKNLQFTKEWGITGIQEFCQQSY